MLNRESRISENSSAFSVRIEFVKIVREFLDVDGKVVLKTTLAQKVLDVVHPHILKRLHVRELDLVGKGRENYIRKKKGDAFQGALRVVAGRMNYLKSIGSVVIINKYTPECAYQRIPSQFWSKVK